MLDSLASFFGGNHAAFIGGLHSLLQDSTNRRADLNWLLANKRIDAHDLSHTFTVARIRGGANELVYGSSGNNSHSNCGSRG